MSTLIRPPCDEGVARAASPTPRARSRGSSRGVLAATVLGSSLAFIDGSVVNVALPAIQADLAAPLAKVQWVVNAYLLLLGSLVLVGGAAADLYGRRRTFVLGVALFAASSLACALAPGIWSLIGARAGQGVAAALLTPASLALLGANFPQEERSGAFGIWSGAGALTTALGPLLGGWLVDVLSWRAVFLINLPVAALAITLAVRRVPESRDADAKALDWPGAIAATLGLGALTLAFSTASSFGWTVFSVALLAVGAVLLAGFLLIQHRSSHPMMPLALYRSPAFSSLNGLTFLLYFALGGALFFLPFELIRVEGFPASAAGAALAPFAVVMGLFSSASGRLADRIGPLPQLVAGPVIAGAGIALLGIAPPAASFWIVRLPAIIVLAAGMTLVVGPLTAAVMNAVDERHIGLASGVNNAVARVAGLLAVASLSALLSTVTPTTTGDTFHQGFRLIMLVAAACAAAAGAVMLIGGRGVRCKAGPERTNTPTGREASMPE